MVLEAKRGGAAVAVLHPMAHLSSPEPKRLSGNLSSPKFIQEGRQEDFHFDKILDANSSQDNVYYSIGLPMASNAMEPLKKNTHVSSVHNHVVLTMGLSNAGKTHTTFGSLKALGRPGRHDEDGLVPRILESLFSQSKHHVSAKASFAVRMTLLHVENDKVHDLLMEPSTSQQEEATPTKSGVMAMVASFERSSDRKAKKEEVNIDQDPATHDYIPDATVKTCWSAVDARELLQTGLTRGLSSRFAGFGKGNSRGHTLVTIQPVIIRGKRRDSTAVDRCGGTIAVLDMAGTERVKKSRAAGAAMRDSIANNSSNSAVLHCLRGIKHNCDVLSGKSTMDIVCDDDETLDGSEISCVSEPKVYRGHQTLKAVPYRQSKVTMLLQPLFSHTAEWNSDIEKTTTVVTMLLAAYPGHRDYVEKRSLLNDFELLLGSDIAKRKPTASSTGLKTHLSTLKESEGTMEDTYEGSEETSSLESDEHEHLDVPNLPRGARSFQSPQVMPSAPVYDVDAMPITVDDVEAPLPPPYAPGTETSMHSVASAPPDDAVYPKEEAPTVSTPKYNSLAVPAPSSQRRTCVVDLPGVTLPPKASPAVPSSNRKHHPTPQSAKHTSRITSVAKVAPSPRYASPPLANPTYKPSPLTASISASPNIKPPKSLQKAKPSPVETQSPSRTWMSGSPIKSISRAVHSSKKKGKKAIEKVDRMLDRSVTNRLSNEFEPSNDASNSALLQRVKVLEKQNAKLSEKNTRLEEKCDQLTEENERLQRAVRESKVKLRRENWTAQDEQEWQHSKRLRVDEQRLIRSPLWEHLENVQNTDEINNRWVNVGKEPFSLQFPSHWSRARDLDNRDRALEGTMAPPASPAVPAVDTFTPSSAQKRDQIHAFQRHLERAKNKRYKH